MMFEPIGTQRKAELVTKGIEERILDGTLKVGDMLPPEEQLAAQFRIGRRPVREALKVLEAKGLIQVRMGVGAIVMRNDLDTFLDALTRNVRSYLSLNKADVQHVRELRALLEGAALERIACHQDPAMLSSLRECLARQTDAMRADDLETYQEWHFRFHCAIVDALHNPVISMVFRQVLQLTRSAMRESTRRPGIIASSIEEHQRILDALVRGEVSGSRVALEEHLAGFVSHVGQPESDSQQAGALEATAPSGATAQYRGA